MTQQRRFPRARARGLVGYVWINEQLSTAIIENVSAGGLFFRTPKPPPLGAAIRVRVIVPGEQNAVELTGRVVSALQPGEALNAGHVPGAGVRFDPIAEANADRFNKVLTSLGLPELAQGMLTPPVATPSVERSPTTEPDDFRHLISYEVHDATLNLAPGAGNTISQKGEAAASELPKGAPQSPQTSSEPQQSTPPPKPVEFSVEVGVAGSIDEHEQQRLVSHVESLMKQLAASEELIRTRDRRIAELEVRINVLQGEQKDRSEGPGSRHE